MKKALFCLLAASGGLLHADPIIKTHQAADVVLGQKTFTTATANSTLASTGVSGPKAVATDPTTGKVYVADAANFRILRFASMDAMGSGAKAEQVIGQSSLDTVTSFAPEDATNLNNPSSLAFDTAGNLYVADTGHDRVLRFDSPSTKGNGIAADAVLGQTGFTDTITHPASASTMLRPTAIAIRVGTFGSSLWVADSGNNRVLYFSNVLSNSATAPVAATKIFGQTAPDKKDAPNPPSKSTMNSPEGIAISDVGVLFVADTGNNRILKFTTAPTAPTYGAEADAVIGQPGFDKNAVPTAASPTNLYSPQNLALEVVPDGKQKGGLSLWVADRLQNRVLRYDGTTIDIPVGLAATLVLGQAGLTGSDYGTDQYSVNNPCGVAIDTTASDTSSPRTVWIADTQNNRVLRFNPHEPLIPTKPQPASPTLGGGAGSFKTKKGTITIRGSASAGAGIAYVTYKGPKGGYKRASGGAAWSFKAHLKVGKNRFTVIAYDTLGRPSPARIITVKRTR